MNKIEEVYEKYYNSVNMSYNELKDWSKNTCSKKASLSREPIRRNLYLLKKKKLEWTKSDIPKANKTISYLARAKEIKSTKEICGGYTRNEIALKNWAYDVKN